MVVTPFKKAERVSVITSDLKESNNPTWVWGSMTPGITYLPSALITSHPSAGRAWPICWIFPFAICMSNGRIPADGIMQRAPRIRVGWVGYAENVLADMVLPCAASPFNQSGKNTPVCFSAGGRSLIVSVTNHSGLKGLFAMGI